MFLAIVWFFAASGAGAQELTPAWVEVGAGGAAIARVVVEARADCPAISIDGNPRAMSPRTPVPDDFRPVCQAEIPAGARFASVNGQTLVLPKRDPSRMVAFGDTGCRILGPQVQACNDPAQWPFLQVASTAAADHPELIIHVGDYLYRESPCPATLQNACGGTPVGDNWDAWNADFFQPAAKLLAAAPWAFTRGNHEDCRRSWRGWFYYLDPRPWSGSCTVYSAPYVVVLGRFQLVVVDSSAVQEDSLDEKQIAPFEAQFRSLHVNGAWLVAHHPFWGFKTNPNGGPALPLSAPLQQAWDRVSPRGISVIFSGHVHLFEWVSLSDSHPLQVVVGDGGTLLADPTDAPPPGSLIDQATITSSNSRHEFGYALLTRTGGLWTLTLKNRSGEPLITCELKKGEPCPSQRNSSN